MVESARWHDGRLWFAATSGLAWLDQRRLQRNERPPSVVMRSLIADDQAMVRQGFGVSIVPQLANVQWSRDRSLRIVPLPAITVQRHVGLLGRSIALARIAASACGHRIGP